MSETEADIYVNDLRDASSQTKIISVDVSTQVHTFPQLSYPSEREPSEFDQPFVKTEDRLEITEAMKRLPMPSNKPMPTRLRGYPPIDSPYDITFGQMECISIVEETITLNDVTTIRSIPLDEDIGLNTWFQFQTEDINRFCVTIISPKDRDVHKTIISSKRHQFFVKTAETGKWVVTFYRIDSHQFDLPLEVTVSVKSQPMCLNPTQMFVNLKNNESLIGVPPHLSVYLKRGQELILCDKVRALVEKSDGTDRREIDLKMCDNCCFIYRTTFVDFEDVGTYNIKVTASCDQPCLLKNDVLLSAFERQQFVGTFTINDDNTAKEKRTEVKEVLSQVLGRDEVIQKLWQSFKESQGKDKKIKQSLCDLTAQHLSKLNFNSETTNQLLEENMKDVNSSTMTAEEVYEELIPVFHGRDRQISVNESYEKRVYIDASIGRNTTFIFESVNLKELLIVVISPKGQSYDWQSKEFTEDLRHNRSLLELASAERGFWLIRIMTIHRSNKYSVTVSVVSQANRPNSGAISLRAAINDKNEFNVPVIYAQLTKDGVPFESTAPVATITGELGAKGIIVLEHQFNNYYCNFGGEFFGNRLIWSGDVIVSASIIFNSPIEVIQRGLFVGTVDTHTVRLMPSFTELKKLAKNYPGIPPFRPLSPNYNPFKSREMKYNNWGTYLNQTVLIDNMKAFQTTVQIDCNLFPNFVVFTVQSNNIDEIEGIITSPSDQRYDSESKEFSIDPNFENFSFQLNITESGIWRFKVRMIFERPPDSPPIEANIYISKDKGLYRPKQFELNKKPNNSKNPNFSPQSVDKLSKDLNTEQTETKEESVHSSDIRSAITSSSINKKKQDFYALLRCVQEMKSLKIDDKEMAEVSTECAHEMNSKTRTLSCSSSDLSDGIVWVSSETLSEEPIEDDFEIIETEEQIDTQKVLQKCEQLLNDLKIRNFPIHELNTEDRLKQFIDILFEKVVESEEMGWDGPYSLFCMSLAQKFKGNVSKDNKKLKFKKLLIERCLQELGTDLKERNEKIDDCLDPEVKKQLNLSLVKDMKVTQTRKLRAVDIICKFYYWNIFGKKKVFRVIDTLLEGADDQSLECLCYLFRRIGLTLDFKTDENQSTKLSHVFLKMELIADQNEPKVEDTSTRTRFMLREIISLRRNRWLDSWNQTYKNPEKIKSDFEERVKQFEHFFDVRKGEKRSQNDSEKQRKQRTAHLLAKVIEGQPSQSKDVSQQKCD